jgi:hypothetical protein
MLHADVIGRIPGATNEVARRFGDVEGWPMLFPETIRSVSVVQRDALRTVVDVAHREGRVRNVLTTVSDREFLLEEWKRRYRARFHYWFAPEGNHTQLVLRGEIWIVGAAALLEPLLGPYVRRQVRRYVVEPLQRAVLYGPGQGWSSRTAEPLTPASDMRRGEALHQRGRSG